MSDVNDKLERQIMRSLDGMLDDREQLELDRELIRNPSARRMMDEYSSADQLASAAFAEIAKGATDPDEIAAIATREASNARTRPHRFNRTWLLIPGAIAAAVLAMVIPKPSFEQSKNDATPMVSKTIDDQRPSQFGNQLPQARRSQPNAPLQTVGSKPSIRRRTGTEWIGVVGDDGNVYWIEVERSRTIRTPHSQKRNAGQVLEM